MRSGWRNWEARILPPSPGKAKVLGIFELVEDYDGDTCRAVYTVRFKEAVYVLHAFQKKSPTGIKTALLDVELVARRLKIAQRDYETCYGKTNR